jgi:hypothetical protein
MKGAMPMMPRRSKNRATSLDNVRISERAQDLGFSLNLPASPSLCWGAGQKWLNWYPTQGVGLQTLLSKAAAAWPTSRADFLVFDPTFRELPSAQN